MDLVARTDSKCLGAYAWMKRTYAVKLRVHLEIFCDVPSSHHTGNPSVRSVMHHVVSHFPVQIDRPQLLGKFHRENHARSARSDAAAHRTVRIVHRDLRE